MNCPRVALIFKTRLEENVNILNGISRFNRYHEKWSAFVDDQAVAQRNPEWLFQKQWDGVICKHSAPDLIRKCVEMSIPCVDLSDDPTTFPTVPKIRPDNVAVGHTGAEHFMERGYKHFAFCGFSSENWSLERRKGFSEALELAHHTCILMESFYPKAADPDWDRKEEDQIMEWLQRAPKPLAIMCCNDLRALQVINACRDLDHQVPEEVDVIGANNESIRCELSYPQLSSIPLNAEYYGKRAAELLSLMLKGQVLEEETALIEPLDVVTRRSTDVLSIEDKEVAEALHLIREKACEGVTVDDLVNHVHVSRSLLEHRFRKHLGKSPQVEIRTVQVQKIKQLLVETDYTLAHISELTGFEHPEYMSVVFKRLTQMTPRQYRKRFTVEST